MSQPSPPQIASAPALSQYPVTALLMAVNVLFFAYAAWQGLDLMNPDLQSAIQWGADFPPLTYLFEPWRLISSMFFHFGLLHLAFNMWALYAFGSVAEPLWGRSALLIIYFAAGLMGNLLSGTQAIWMTLHNAVVPAVSGGASGAIMGLAGALTMWSCLPALPQQRIWLNRKALIIILLINLIIGMSISAINQTAHVGGLVMGALLAVLAHSTLRLGYRLSVLLAVLGGVSLMLCGLAYWINLTLLNDVLPVWQGYFRR